MTSFHALVLIGRYVQLSGGTQFADTVHRSTKRVVATESGNVQVELYSDRHRADAMFPLRVSSALQ